MSKKTQNMNYKKLLKKLYGSKEEALINLINVAISLNDYKPKQESIIVNTGFVFYSFKNKGDGYEKLLWTLLFDLETETVLIKQYNSKNDLPFNGVIVFKTKDGDYKNYSPPIIMSIIGINDLNKSEILQLAPNIDYEEKMFNGRLFLISKETKDKSQIRKIIIKSNSELDRTFPLEKEFEQHLICFNGTFSEAHYNEDYYVSYKDTMTYEDYENYGNYEGSWAQEIEGFSDDYINDVLGGEPDAYWNID